MASSPLICSAFDNSGLYLAYGIVNLDTHTIKVQSTNPSASSLSNSFKLNKGSRLTSLSWASVSSDVVRNKNNKAKTSDLGEIESMVVAIGLNNGQILIYSPFENQIIATLQDSRAAAITSFVWSDLTGTAWSCDYNGSIIEWDLNSFEQKRSFKVNDDIELKKVVPIQYNNKVHLLVSSHTVHLIDPANPNEIIMGFPGHISPIHTILPVLDHEDLFFTSAANDRFVNLYSITKRTTQTIFVAQSNISALSYGEAGGKSVLLAITEQGSVEIFNDPIAESSLPTSSSSSKKKRKGGIVQSRSCNGFIRLSRPETDRIRSKLNINCSIVLDSQIIMSWLEDAIVPFFDRINWVDSPVHGDTNLIKAKPDLRVTDHSLYGEDIAAPKKYNEGNAIITDGDNFRDLDPREEEDEEEMDTASKEETLADQLENLNVEHSSGKSKKKKIGATPGTLTVVLSQALKANDHSLLETVLVNRDETIIKGSIQRLDSSLAVILLDRLAERIARQSNRQGPLNIWIKWIMVIHGGYLVSLPNLSKVLSSLHTTLSKRASTLPRLMVLQSKLDMVYSQIELKRDILGNIEADSFDDEDDSDVEYNEELDDARDAHLIDDVSMEEDQSDFEVDPEQDDYISMESSDGEDDESEMNTLLEIQAEDYDDEAEDAYSDVEVGIEEEQSDLEEQIDSSHIQKKKSANRIQ